MSGEWKLYFAFIGCLQASTILMFPIRYDSLIPYKTLRNNAGTYITIKLPFVAKATFHFHISA